MRLWMVAFVCVLIGCSSSGPKAASPGIARFVGTWESAGARGATLVVQGDQKARLMLRTDAPKPTELRGMCIPGSDTVTFVVDAGSGSERTTYLFSTRPDGTLAVTIEGVPMRLMRR